MGPITALMQFIRQRGLHDMWKNDNRFWPWSLKLVLGYYADWRPSLMLVVVTVSV